MANGKGTNSRSILSRVKLVFISLVLLDIASLILQNNSFGSNILRSLREGETTKLSIDLGDGDCYDNIVDNLPRILFASYPSSEMRLTWQQKGGIAGLLVGNDGEDKHETDEAILKTQYPHYEGNWVWGDRMDRVILVVRNPRWALPSYFGLKHKRNKPFYYRYLSVTPPVESWKTYIRGRFEEEVKLWCWFIDYWIEGGTQYWANDNNARDGIHPYGWVNETDRIGTKDKHCENYANKDMCVATTVVSHDRLLKGTAEADKVATVLDGKLGYVSGHGSEPRECIWHMRKKTTKKSHMPHQDETTNLLADFKFEHDQMLYMISTLSKMADKYRSQKWKKNPLAKDLVSLLHEYIDDISVEMEVNDIIYEDKKRVRNYTKILSQWFRNLGGSQ